MEGALSWHEIWRYVHITAGFVGLGVFWVPVFAKKGAPVHVWGGRIFALCAYVVGATAVISSAWALADPIGFIARPQVSPETTGTNRRRHPLLFFHPVVLGACATAIGSRGATTHQNPQ